MKATRIPGAAVLCLLGLSSGPGVRAQAPTAETPTFGASTAAVVLDVVVRDKKQRAVRDLQASDFEVFEDGVRQQLESFTIVSRPLTARAVPNAAPAVEAAGTTTPAAAGPASRTTEGAPSLITFAFDRLSPTGRNLASRAALLYLEQGRREDDLVAVYTIDLALHPLLPFTSDAAKVRLAIRRAASQGNTATASAAERADARAVTAQADTLKDQREMLTQGGFAGGQTSGPPANQVGALLVRQLILESRARTLRAFQGLEQDQQGYATSKALMAMVTALEGIPGRKTIVFFSEGVSATSKTRGEFEAVVAAANRANVAIYAMDVAGLRVESNFAEVREELHRDAMRRPADGELRDSFARGVERSEELRDLNPEYGLGLLAHQTGGFLIRDTNDPREAFLRIGEDMRFHYLLSYSPTNENYDGKFRRVSVRLKRRGLEIHSRDGYRAWKPGPSPAAAASTESVAARQLDQVPSPGAFPIQAVGLSLPDPAHPGLVPILVRVPGTAVTYGRAVEDRHLRRTDFAIVARIKDAEGAVVGRVSRHYFLTASASRKDAPTEDVLFYREANLRPGHYVLEAAAYDAITNQASVTRQTFEVGTETQAGLRLSSLVLVKAAQALPTDPARGIRPLDFGESSLLPNLGEPVRKSEGGTLTFYFAAIPPKDGPPPAEALVELFSAGRAVKRSSTLLAPPNATGRIQAAAALPLDGLSAGAYELKVTVADGRERATASAPFTVEN